MQTNTFDVRWLPVILTNREKEVYKKQRALEVLHSAGFANVEVFCALERYNKDLSICLTQLAAINQKKPPFIVVEDDIAINPVAPCFEYIVPVDTDVLFLGVSKNGACCTLDTEQGAVFRETSCGLFKVYEMFCAHARLFLTAEAVRAASYAIAKAIQHKQAQDIWVTRELSRYNAVAAANPLFYQNDIFRIDETLFNISEYLKTWNPVCPKCGRNKLEAANALLNF